MKRFHSVPLIVFLLRSPKSHSQHLYQQTNRVKLSLKFNHIIRIILKELKKTYWSSPLVYYNSSRIRLLHTKHLLSKSSFTFETRQGNWPCFVWGYLINLNWLSIIIAVSLLEYTTYTKLSIEINQNSCTFETSFLLTICTYTQNWYTFQTLIV